MQSTRRKFFSDTLIYTAAQVLLRLRSLVTLPLFSRMLGAAGYGIFTQINITVNLLVPFISFRLDTAVVRFLAGEDDKKRFRDRYYIALFFITTAGIILSLILSAISGLSSNLIFGDPAYGEYMALVGWLLVTTTVLNYLINYYRITQRIKILSWLSFGESALGIVLMLLAVYFGYGLKGALWGLIISNLPFIPWLFIAIGREIGWFGFTWKGLRAMLAYGIPLMPNSFLQWGVNYADRLVITQILGLAAIGTYSASYSLGALINLIVTPISFVLFPFVSRHWDKGEIEETRRYFSYVTRYFILIALPATVGLAMVSQYILRDLTTSEFATSRLMVFWIAFGFMVNGLFQINVYVFHLVQKTTYVMWILLVSLIANVVLNIFLVPVVGINGSAFATAVTFFLMCVFSMAYGRRLIYYTIDWLGIAKSLLASAGMALCLYWIPVKNIAGILGVSLLGAAFYMAALFVLQTFTKTELVRLRSLIRSYVPITIPNSDEIH
jgi:O-antigen/teichoic acid export membrane protein